MGHDGGGGGGYTLVGTLGRNWARVPCVVVLKVPRGAPPPSCGSKTVAAVVNRLIMWDAGAHQMYSYKSRKVIPVLQTLVIMIYDDDTAPHAT